MKKIFLLLLLMSQFSFSQSMGLDTTFNPGDLGFDTGYGPNGSVTAMQVQADGKILIIGSFTAVNGIPCKEIARLNPDASLDSSFNAGTGSGSTSLNSLKSIALQSDGKILVAGDFDSFNGNPIANLVRLLPDGSVDTSFTTIFDPSQSITYIQAQADDKILVSGYFTGFVNNLRINVARLLPDGNLDLAFDTGSGIYGQVSKFAVQPDGKVLMAGAIVAVQGYGRDGVARLNADGSIDLGFNAGTASQVKDLILLADGRMIVAGLYNNQGKCFRLNPNGLIDPTFGSISFPGTTNWISSLQLISGGKILATGNFAKINDINCNNITCFSSDGVLDTSFSLDGATGRINCTAMLPDGKIFLGGAFSTYRYFGNSKVIRVNTDGTPDASFAFSGTGANGEVKAVYPYPNDKIIIAGTFTRYNNQNILNLCRLNNDGSIDSSFNQWQGLGFEAGTIPQINRIITQPDGKIIIAGLFKTVNGHASGGVARLNPDGSYDTSFNSPFTGISAIYSLCLQPDGKILAGGVRLNVDGTADTGYTVLPFNGIIRDIHLLTDGKILVVGDFTANGVTLCTTTDRLNANGTQDTSYSTTNSYITSGRVNRAIILPDGKIFIAGHFNSVSGQPVYDMAVLNTNGSHNPAAFSSGTGVSGATYTEVFDAFYDGVSGKIVIVGNFSFYNGVSQKSIARINLDGTLDTTFNYPGNGFDNAVNSAYLLPNGNIMAGGTFTSMNGFGRNRLARLTIVPDLSTIDTPSDTFIVYPNPFTNSITVKSSLSTPLSYELFEVTGHKIQGGNLLSGEIQTAYLSKGVYLLKLISEGNITVKKVVKQ